MRRAGAAMRRLSIFATVEILKDNASSLANDLYTALDMTFATLVQQLFAARTTQPSTA